MFNIILSPYYFKGRNFSLKSLKNIPLPNDNLKALETTFNAIYYYIEAINNLLNPALLLRVVIINILKIKGPVFFLSYI